MSEVNVLIVGSGGREHALAWKLQQSPIVGKLYCAPGNAGIANVAECVPIGVNDFDTLIAFAREKDIGLTVVGPEDPLTRGIVDAFEKEGLVAFGPSAKAAQLEGSKAFAKQMMAQWGIPTAAYAEFTKADKAVAYIQERGVPIVIKADGLAAGKGVTVAHTVDEAIGAIHAAMSDRVFGDAGAKVVVEECLVGEEASILALSDGTTIMALLPSQDHKAAFDNDEGPNTGGMGAYAPAPVVTDDLKLEIQRTILEPCIAGMNAMGIPFKGVLYAGLMITKEGPKVIEFNCRFGDPETQVTLPQLKGDLLPLLLACCTGTLDQHPLEWEGGACVSVVMASPGYPGEYPKGLPIEGIDRAELGGNAMVFHAGTAVKNGQLVTNGGRVLNVTALGDGIAQAIDKAYKAVNCIEFKNAHFRRDIGKKALAKCCFPRI
ncbi:MAG: phosphoribosylamine--glycine ligase [Candidatus Hydrogenedentota bacterium]